MWHWCLPNGRQFSFLCPNGTVFSQTTRVCDWWFKVFYRFNVIFRDKQLICLNFDSLKLILILQVDCNDSPRLYGNNDELYRDVNGNKI